MTLLNILEYPDPRLRTKAESIESFDDRLSSFAKNMFKTMYDAKGIGLAATQVDYHKRLIVLDISDNQDYPMCIINPEIIKKAGKTIYEEGCLSVPGIFEKVDRFKNILVRYCELDGTTVEIEAEGLLAICIQHEIDHLNGKLFVDYLSSLKRSRLKKQIDKLKTSSSETVDTDDLPHEMDHLNGKLFVDYLSSLKRSRLKKQIDKLKTSSSETVDTDDLPQKRVI